jgi:hypothetical protein
VPRSRNFRQSDLNRALKATIAAGLKIARIEIDREGKIIVIPLPGAQPDPATAYDEWVQRHARAP